MWFFSCELVPTYSLVSHQMWIHLLLESLIYLLKHIFVLLLDSLMLTRALCFFNGMDILVEASKHRGVLCVHRVLFAFCFCALGISKVLALLIFSLCFLLSVS